MEIKVGDYIRFDGEIAKIRDIKRYKTKENIYVFDRILDLNEDRSCNDNTIYNSQWKYFDNVKSSIEAISKDNKGQGAAEYILLFGGVIVIALAGLLIYRSYFSNNASKRYRSTRR